MIKYVKINTENQFWIWRYVYGEADFEANNAMQEPLKKLYEYEELESKKQNEKVALND